MYLVFGKAQIKQVSYNVVGSEKVSDNSGIYLLFEAHHVKFTAVEGKRETKLEQVDLAVFARSDKEEVVLNPYSGYKGYHTITPRPGYVLVDYIFARGEKSAGVSLKGKVNKLSDQAIVKFDNFYVKYCCSSLGEIKNKGLDGLKQSK